jgi:hypothetical protein
VKTCKGCGETKPLDEFYKITENRDGRTGKCKVCIRAQNAAYKASQDPRDIRSSKLEYKYGITLEVFEEMLESQGGRCAICDKGADAEERAMHVDHDHKCCPYTKNQKICGRCIRGILCRHCNVSLGWLEGDPKRLDRVLKYLGLEPTTES